MNKLIASLFIVGMVGSVTAAYAMGAEPEENKAGVEDSKAPLSQEEVTVNMMPAFEKARVSLSGAINVDMVKSDYIITNLGNLFFTPSDANDTAYAKKNRNFYVGNAKLNVDTSMDAVRGHIGLVYLGRNDKQTIHQQTYRDDIVNKNLADGVWAKTTGNQSSVLLDEAYLHWDEIFNTPLSFEAGQVYTDFGLGGFNGGQIDRYPLIKSPTQQLSQSRARVLKLGINDVGLNGLHASVYSQDSLNTNSASSFKAWGANAGYNFSTNFVRDVQWGINLSYVSDPSAVELLQYAEVVTPPKGAYAANAHAKSGKWAGSLSVVHMGRLSDLSPQKNNQPAAWDALISYTNDFLGAGTDSTIALAYGGSKQAKHLGNSVMGLPEHTLTASYNQAINDYSTFSFLVSREENYKSKPQANVAQHEDGQQNNRFAARLSVFFD